jgi:hypothetical protein
MTNKFKEKQILAEVLSELFETVEIKEKSVRTDYKPVGEKQGTDWRTGELQWEDEEKTIPKMVPDYANVEKTAEEFTEEDKLRLKVYAFVKAQLEKMI